MHTDHNYNPDVLSCIANLSSDEVFTPPELVNQMLDLLPPNLFNDKHTTFLDPACKSGVFLREIAKRLDKGLESQIPDIQKRINHIFTKQLFGLAITELTALLSRRSLYCSKNANGKYSVCTKFNTDSGNIIYNRIEHIWENGRCKFCGANEQSYDRGAELESHAYSFIHTEIPEELFKMKFDVIIGNPPYQLSDEGGEGYSAIPLYNLFIEQSIKLQPRFVSMIIPARWYSGGKGLDSFRERMLTDKHIMELHDFSETTDCFPGLNIRGGVCYFLWSAAHDGDCKVYNHKGLDVSVMERPLLEDRLSIFIRYNLAIGITRKVLKYGEPTMDAKVMPRNAFGISSNFSRYSKVSDKNYQILLYRGDRSTRSLTDRMVFIKKEDINKGLELKDKIKVLVSKASPGGDEYPHSIITKPIIARLNSVCTETYLVVAVCNSQNEARHMVQYMSTKFFRFMLALVKNTQNISKRCFQLVPQLDMSQSWTDVKLYKKYNLSKEEIDFIESMIRPMELPDA